MLSPQQQAAVGKCFGSGQFVHPGPPYVEAGSCGQNCQVFRFAMSFLGQVQEMLGPPHSRTDPGVAMDGRGRLGEVLEPTFSAEERVGQLPITAGSTSVWTAGSVVTGCQDIQGVAACSALLAEKTKKDHKAGSSWLRTVP